MYLRKPRNNTRDWKPIFLAAFAETGQISDAARQAGVVRQTVFYAVRRDPAFAGEYRLAEKAARRAAKSAILLRLRAQPGPSLEACSDAFIAARLSSLRRRGGAAMLNSLPKTAF